MLFRCLMAAESPSVTIPPGTFRRTPLARGAHLQLRGLEAVFVTQADGVVFEGNTVVSGGKLGGALVQTTSTAEGTGAKVGVVK